MGKIRTRFIGDESLEETQKKEQKERTARKKAEKMAESIEKHVEKEELEKPAEEAKKPVEKKEEAKASPKKVHIRGKKYKDARKKIEEDKLYVLSEAIELLKKTAYAKFPESIEVHMNLVSTGLKGEVELPHSTGKDVIIAIVDDTVIAKLEKGVIDFDMLIAHPSFMPRLAKFARVLGPKGLMPNPKSGTVSVNPEEVAKKFQKGTLRWKSEPKFPLLHQMVAKVTADNKAIEENIVALLSSVGRKNFTAVWIKSTMSPSLKIDIAGME